ncbi:putative methyltransferase DDB_G0268948 isoform X1 [Podarcis lilfordi]|uniref:Methyltransferase DDB_G0268948 isoform X1 n=1 Tax=Podarcis lilfordi TaxID=74358 RepID=A0AA35LFF5_9SAUR|nr:putative methyltransferase DDB_G0268948 isoform X1 [Podarcis lilfordi]
MATRLFEERAHTAIYRKYRLSPQENLQGVIFPYLEEKHPSALARATTHVDCQLPGAHSLRKDSDTSHKCIARVCPAEDLPFEDGSVDLVTAFAAVHWFDGPRFLREVDRVLKPSGCVVFSSYNWDMQLCYKDCTDELTEIFREHALNSEILDFKLVENDYQEIFDSLPFQEKQRFLETMGVSSRDTQLELCTKHICILGCKSS